jgi:probable HAF family extracellular repeat protein
MKAHKLQTSLRRFRSARDVVAVPRTTGNRPRANQPVQIVGTLILAAVFVTGSRALYMHRMQPRVQSNLAVGKRANPFTHYTVVDIGAGRPMDDSVAFSLNNLGQVIIVIGEHLDRARSYLWDAGKWTDLGSLGGGTTVARSINDAGQIVGRALTAQNEERPFVWCAGKMTNLGTLGGEPADRGLSNEAHCINNQGQAVGAACTRDHLSHFFVWQGGKLVDHGKSVPGGESAAYGINDTGQVVGYYLTKSYSTRAFLLFSEHFAQPFVYISATAVFEPLQVNHKIVFREVANREAYARGVSKGMSIGSRQ